jgi:hypothetical protein
MRPAARVQAEPDPGYGRDLRAPVVCPLPVRGASGPFIYTAAAALAVLTLACGASEPGDAGDASDRAPIERAARAFRAKVALNPIGLDGDPYAHGDPRSVHDPLHDGAVCALRYDADRVQYRLETFPDEKTARRTGFIVTHFGACGTCSTLQDLAVYLARPDLTTPVRRCAAFGLTHARTLRCLTALGFSEACAETWYYDAMNTRRECGWVCVTSWLTGESSNRPDGRLNDCLQCDEDRSGPVFKRVAGRTRRNSGIRSSIERSPRELPALVHDYY